MYLVNRGIGQIDVFMYNITWLACACLACFGCSGLCSLQLGPTIYTLFWQIGILGDISVVL